ncbi:MAG: hypothetical protein ABSB99_04925 [Acidimicrobiales bacterium]
MLDEDEDFEGPLPLELSGVAPDDPEDPSEDLGEDETSLDETSLDLAPEEAAGLEEPEAERLSVL